MTDFGWDYPPGVTGFEPEIVGYDEEAEEQEQEWEPEEEEEEEED